MRLFLDTSVLVAAAGSTVGASRVMIELAPANGWELLTSPYALGEADRNIARFPLGVRTDWSRLRPLLQVVQDIVSLDRPVVFLKTKDRPILFSAAAWADVLVTLDREDFQRRVGRSFYELQIRTPASFLDEQRASGTLKTLVP